ncbi:hypothetical protein SADUNF_Sadunf16G0023900 [Salix dunnii]|uniref:Uncharacterized protein n=1 Tax=Salix dunnii TaxID=1413687 RepID=A0A835J4N0_9ROSI|nr:hypothetical protein SADUNF_Sadunf16G0023900 [Salix dunnii]
MATDPVGFDRVNRVEASKEHPLHVFFCHPNKRTNERRQRKKNKKVQASELFWVLVLVLVRNSSIVHSKQQNQRFQIWKKGSHVCRESGDSRWVCVKLKL